MCNLSYLLPQAVFIADMTNDEDCDDDAEDTNGYCATIEMIFDQYNDFLDHVEERR